MFIKDGIVYGEQPDTGIKVKEVKVLPDMILILTFSNGEMRLFDATILEGEVYKDLANPEIFNKATLDHGVVTWKDGDIDCAPEYMYKNSYEYSFKRVIMPQSSRHLS